MYTVNMVKLRNAIRKIDPSLRIELRNVRINQSLQGCSGFVSDESTGRVVYVSTDRNHGTVRDILVRVARHTKDYTGGRNRFVEYTAEDAARGIVELLRLDSAHREYEQDIERRARAARV